MLRLNKAKTDQQKENLNSLVIKLTKYLLEIYPGIPTAIQTRPLSILYEIVSLKVSLTKTISSNLLVVLSQLLFKKDQK